MNTLKVMAVGLATMTFCVMSASATNEVWRMPGYDYKYSQRQPDGSANWSSDQMPGLKWRVKVRNAAVDSALIGDLNGDGEDDVVVTAGGAISAYSLSGIRLWSGGPGFKAYRLVDIDGNGRSEVVAQKDSQIAILDGLDGSTLFTTQPWGLNWAWDIEFVDVNNDGVLEMIAAQDKWNHNESNWVRAFAFDVGLSAGYQLWGSANAVRGKNIEVGHYANDGQLFLLISSRANSNGDTVKKGFMLNAADGTQVDFIAYDGGTLSGTQGEEIWFSDAADSLHQEFLNSGSKWNQPWTLNLIQYDAASSQLSRVDWYDSASSVEGATDGGGGKPALIGDYDMDGRDEIIQSMEYGGDWVTYWIENQLTNLQVIASDYYTADQAELSDSGLNKEIVLRQQDDAGFIVYAFDIGVHDFVQVFETNRVYLGVYKLTGADYVAYWQEDIGGDVVFQTWTGSGDTFTVTASTLPNNESFSSVIDVVDTPDGKRIILSSSSGFHLYDESGGKDVGRVIAVEHGARDGGDIKQITGYTARGVECVLHSEDNRLIGVYEEAGTAKTYQWTAGSYQGVEARVVPLAFHDYNNDGFDDLLIHENISATNFVFRVYSGAGTNVIWTSQAFENMTFRDTISHRGYNLFDVTADGIDDLVFIYGNNNQTSGTLASGVAMLNGSNGQLDWLQQIGNSLTNQSWYLPSPLPTDWGANGTNDVQLFPYQSGNPSYVLNGPTGDIQFATSLALVGQLSSLTMGEFNTNWPGLDFYGVGFALQGKFGSLPYSNSVTGMSTPGQYNINNPLAAADVDGDGIDEVIERHWHNMEIVAHDITGTDKWKMTLTNEYVAGFPTPDVGNTLRDMIVADLATNAGLEIAFAGLSGTLYLFGAEGTSSVANAYSERLIGTIDLGVRLNALQAVDIDGDDQLELVAFDDEGYMNCFDVAPSADLVVYSSSLNVGAGSAIAVGGETFFTVDVDNQGAADSGPFEVTFGDVTVGQFSANGSLYNQSVVTITNGLDAGASITVTSLYDSAIAPTNLFWKPTVAGNHTISVNAAADGWVEANPFNNLFLSTINVYDAPNGKVVDVAAIPSPAVLNATNIIQVRVTQEGSVGSSGLYGPVRLRLSQTDGGNPSLVTGLVTGVGYVLVPQGSTSVVEFAWTPLTTNPANFFASFNMNTNGSGYELWSPTNATIHTEYQYAADGDYSDNVIQSTLLTVTADDDGDGVSDAWEITWFGNTNTVNSTSDYDGEGLLDLEEFQMGTSPTNIDTDGDSYNGIGNDWYEVKVAYVLNPDTDEYEGTDPNDPDSDGGGIQDGVELYYTEVYYKMNPLDAMDDGFYQSNPIPYVEITTADGQWVIDSPYAVDGVSTNITGIWIEHTGNAQLSSFSPTSPFTSAALGLTAWDNQLRVIGTNDSGASASDSIIVNLATAGFDYDGDGMNDLDEWIAGTTITDSNSIFQLQDIMLVSNDPVLSWLSVTGREYAVLYHTNLLEITSSTDWFTSDFTNVSGTGGLLIYTNGTPYPEQFYRIEVERQ